MFIMSSQEQKFDALLKVMTDLTKSMQLNSSYDSILGAARSMRSKKGGTEHKQRLPEEEYRIRNHFIDNLRHVQLEEVKERQKIAKRISAEDKRLSKVVRKHAKVDSEATANVQRLHRAVADIGSVLKDAGRVLKNYNDEMQTHNEEYEKQLAQYRKINNSFEKLGNNNINAGDLSNLKQNMASVSGLLPDYVIDGVNQRIEALSRTLNVDPQDTIDASFNQIIKSLGSSVDEQTKLWKKASDVRIKDIQMTFANEQQASDMIRQRILPFLTIIDDIKKVEGDFASGVGRFAEAFGKDSQVNTFARDANKDILAFKDILDKLSKASDPKEIEKLDKAARANADGVFRNVGRLEARIAKLKTDRELSIINTIKMGMADIAKDTAYIFQKIVKPEEDGDRTAGVDMLTSKLGGVFSTLASGLGKVGGYIINRAKDVVLKEIVPDRLALMKYGTLATGHKDWTDNIRLASTMGMSSPELAQLRAEQRALLLTTQKGEGSTLSVIADLVNGVVRENSGTKLVSRSTNDEARPISHYFGGSTKDRVDASLAGLTMLRNSGITTSFENLTNTMDKYTIDNQKITGLTQHQLFTYASDIMDLSDNQELLSGATEDQQKAMLANTFKLQEVYTGLGYSTEQAKMLTEETAKMRKGMSGKDKLKGLATIPMMGSMLGLNQNQMKVLQEYTDANARGGTALAEFKTVESNSATMKEIVNLYDKKVAGDGSYEGMYLKMVLETLSPILTGWEETRAQFPASAKLGVTKKDVADQKLMTDGTIKEDRVIMGLDTAMTAWTKGLLHGALSIDKVADTIKQYATSIATSSPNVSSSLKLLVDTIHGLIDYFGVVELLDSPEIAKKIKEKNDIIAGLEAAKVAADNSGITHNPSVASWMKSWVGLDKDYSGLVGKELEHTFIQTLFPKEAAKKRETLKYVHNPLNNELVGNFNLNSEGKYELDRSRYTDRVLNRRREEMADYIKEVAEKKIEQAKQDKNDIRESYRSLVNGQIDAFDRNTKAVDRNTDNRNKETEPSKKPSDTKTDEGKKTGGIKAPSNTSNDTTA